jgi:peptidoglycan/LPS O-acetylase OafA/YrhL
MTEPIPQSTFSDSKKHLLILDALRGIAAIMVLIMHVFELYCKGDFHQLIVAHGYLAVDFFFMLSGYVMAHAYDDRWDRMTAWDFCKRRLIRLHPLIILGMVLGALTFYAQASPVFNKVADTTVWQLLFTMVIGFTLIPLSPARDIKGWNEMHPLNGPAWSLFMEYIANILHVFVLRKMSKIVLGFFVLLAATALFNLTVFGPRGDVIGGWSLEPEQIKIAFTRLLFPYMMGMLVRRVIKLRQGKNTFLLTSLLLIAVLAFPRVGGYDDLWKNGLYEFLVITLVFPLIIYLGAIGEVRTELGRKVSVFLGDISYPLYITHFPFICMYYGWVSRNDVSVVEGLPLGIGLIIFVIVLAWLSLRFYDLPVRRWLARRFM